MIVLTVCVSLKTVIREMRETVLHIPFAPYVPFFLQKNPGFIAFKYAFLHTPTTHVTGMTNLVHLYNNAMLPLQVLQM